MSTQSRLLMLAEILMSEREGESRRERGRDGEQTDREREGGRLLHARIPHFIAG